MMCVMQEVELEQLHLQLQDVQQERDALQQQVSFTTCRCLTYLLSHSVFTVRVMGSSSVHGATGAAGASAA